MRARDERGQNLLRPLIASAEHTVGIRRPDDIPLRRLVRKQRCEPPHRVQPQYFILYPDEQVTPPFTAVFTGEKYHSI